MRLEIAQCSDKKRIHMGFACNWSEIYPRHSGNLAWDCVNRQKLYAGNNN
jgi:hypothetical protein